MFLPFLAFLFGFMLPDSKVQSDEVNEYSDPEVVVKPTIPYEFVKREMKERMGSSLQLEF